VPERGDPCEAYEGREEKEETEGMSARYLLDMNIARRQRAGEDRTASYAMRHKAPVR
jgi:hypothetical protein